MCECVVVNGDVNQAIIKPARGKNSPDPGRLVVMVSNRADLDAVARCLNLKPENARNVMMSRLHTAGAGLSRISVIGPMIGAPYAALLMENLIAWGARQFVFFGWCGSISPRIRIGDIIVPTAAFIDEGLSKHYQADEQIPARPSVHINRATTEVLNRCGVDWHEGVIWTTDAIFRETSDRIEYFQSKEAIAVEMEISALCSVAVFRNVRFGSICVVSDELATLNWRPGFGDPRFRQSRKTVCEVIKNLCPML